MTPLKVLMPTLGIPIFVCSRRLNDKGACSFLIQASFEEESGGNHIPEGSCLTGKCCLVETPGSSTFRDEKVSGSR